MTRHQQHQSLTTPSNLAQERAERPYLLLEDLVNSPIAFMLSDFSLPEALPAPPPALH